MSNNFENIHYAQWLETALKELLNFPVKGICMNALADDGTIYTNYYQISMQDKLTISGIIQQDAMLDTLRANGYIGNHDDEPTDEE